MKKKEGIVIGFANDRKGVGGPATFQERLGEQLREKGLRVVYPKDNSVPDIVLINGGAVRKTNWILHCKLKGAKVVHRTANVFWKHRVAWPGVQTYWNYTWNNIVIKQTRRSLADHVIYQSVFAYNIFKERMGISDKEKNTIIYNGTDLTKFFPSKKRIQIPRDQIKVVCVEGSIEDEPFVQKLLEILPSHVMESIRVVVNIYGRVSHTLKERFVKKDHIVFHGVIERSEIPSALRENDVFLSLEVNGACPNSILEAMACGVPVISFDTGAARELIGEDGGILIPYRGNIWELEAPRNCDEIVPALTHIYDNHLFYKKNARKRATNCFDAEKMTASYLKVFDQLVRSKIG